MGRSEQHILSQNPVTNNCPECFNQDLTLTFYQKHLRGNLFDRITSELSHELKCNTCDTVIYPVSWTDDIERSVEYYQKAVKPEKPVVKFRPLFFVVVILGILLAGTLIYLVLRGAI
ncbi:hypothetical protein [Robiginitalea aurantiaca]|uniref:Uncharacterized protein n=1 Tax=Robiginitalea aurantiaca TaxID=3056915 RepID=A0ABT7WEJ9_9FLAO|nr:hypothetical protein [Robiginitalea aurantiaca]MDM9631351.1 hypothetical protein [Robiginitalea aurantiaca]